MYLGLFFVQNLWKRVWFLDILHTHGSFAKFCDVLLEFCAWKILQIVLIKKLLHHYLKKGKKKKN